MCLGCWPPRKLPCRCEKSTKSQLKNSGFAATTVENGTNVICATLFDEVFARGCCTTSLRHFGRWIRIACGEKKKGKFKKYPNCLPLLIRIYPYCVPFHKGVYSNRMLFSEQKTRIQHKSVITTCEGPEKCVHYDRKRTRNVCTEIKPPSGLWWWT